MLSTLDRYLRAAPPAPNARLPELKIPYTHDALGGGVDWWGLSETLAEDLVAAGTPEAEQGLGRLLGATVQALGGEPGLERVAELLLFGDAASTAFARDVASRQSLLLRNSGWLDDVVARAGDVVAPGFSTVGVDRTLVDGMMDAIASGHYLRRSFNGWGLTSVRHAIEQLLAVLLRFRRDLAPEEVATLAHGLLNPGAPHPAPGGLWSRSTRHGVVVRVAYGRGRRDVLRVVFRRNHVLTREDLPDYGAPIHNHILTAFKPAPGAAPADGDRRAALADLVQRGVRVWHGRDLAPAEAAELAAAGFEGGQDFMTISHARARALALLLPRPIG